MPQTTSTPTAEPVAPTTPVATQAPAPATPATPAATSAPAADISDKLAQDSAISKILSSSPKKKEKPAAATPAPVAAPAATEPAATPSAAPATPATPPAPAKPQLKVRKPTPQAAPFDPSALAAMVTAGVTAAMPKPAEPVAEVIELPEHLAPNKSLYEQLESIDPKYKGITRKMADFGRKELEYAAKWEDDERRRLIAEGKGAEAKDVAYDAEDQQHQHFYKRNAPQIDPRDIRRAEVKIEVDAIRKAESTGKADEVGELKKELARMKAAPAADASVAQFNTGLARTLSEAAELTPQSLQKWAEANPIEADVANQLREQVSPVIHAASLLWDGVIDLNQNDSSHTAAADTFRRFESELHSAGDAAVDENGRPWVPLAEYNKMSKADQAKYSTTTKQALVAYIVMNTAQQVKNVAKSQREIVERTAARLGYQKPQASPVTHQPAVATPSKPAPAITSPSVSGSEPITPSAGMAPAPKAESTNYMARMLGSK